MRTKDRGQNTEDRKQRTEGRGQKTEDRIQSRDREGAVDYCLWIQNS